MNENEILQLLKDKLNTIKHFDEDDFNPESMKNSPNRSKSSKSSYYFKLKRNNLFDGLEPFHEIDERYNSIGSSAAFVFNTFGNIGSKFKYNNNEYCIMAYEKELPAIKSTLKSHEHNAHLDAYIINDKEEIFVETKLIEWLKPPKNLHPAYLDKHNYLYTDDADFFIEIFKSLISNQLVRDSKGEYRYKSKYEKYDAIQMTIHTLAIYNYCLSKSNKKNIIKLWNVVFDYKEADKYITEEQEANDFIKKYSGKFNELFLNIGINFELQYIPFSEFYKKIEFDDIRHKEYLKRYIID